MPVVAHLRSIDPPWAQLLIARPGRTFESLRRQPRGFVVRSLDGRKCGTKRGLLAEFVRRLAFPAYFGRNWDAFEECLADLTWLPATGYLIVVTDAEQLLTEHEPDYVTFIEIMQATGREWATAQPGDPPRAPTPFHLLLAVQERHWAARSDWRVPPLRW